MECVLNEKGIAQVPALHAIPQFNLEEELARATQFTLEPAAVEKGKPRHRVLTRDQLASLVRVKPAEAGHEEHDE